MAPKPANLAKMKFGRLLVLELAPRVRSGNRYRVAWKCVCECGNQAILTSDVLLSGNTKSCGCYNRDAHVVHNGVGTPEYRAWRAMLDRCYNDQNKRFKHYGGRGIIVCDRWHFGENGKHPFQCFLEDVGQRPECSKPREWSIDRINNDDIYRPGNIQWIMDEQQSRNRRTYRNGIHRVLRRNRKTKISFRVRIDGHYRSFRTFEEARAAARL